MTETDLQRARSAVLAHLVGMHRTAEAAIQNRAEGVEQARRFGATWQDIGEALGMTRQAAYKKFGEQQQPRKAGKHEQ